MKVQLKLKATEDVNGYKKDDIVIITNDIFDRQNGVAFFPIDKQYEIIELRQFVGNFKGIDIYENDNVLVRGSKRNGEYETKVIKCRQGFTLEKNKTLLNDDACLSSIIRVIENIYGKN